MKKPLFTTSVVITKNEKEIKSFLMDLPAILKWDQEINSVEKISDHLYKILRKKSVLNREESIFLEESENTVNYHVTGDVVSYTIEL